MLIAFASYGLAHCGYVLVTLVVAAEGTAGLGVFLTALAFAWMLVAVLKPRESQKLSLPTGAGPGAPGDQQ